MDVLGPLLRDHYPVVPDSSRKNLLAAFDKRCNFYDSRRVSREIVQANVDLLDRLAPTAWDPVEWTPELFHAWNAQFPAAKQARHLRVLPRISEITSKEFSNKQIFVKVEALLKRHDPNWAPRVIYQSSDIHNALLGPVMQKCTKRMFGSLLVDQGQDQVNYKGAYSANSDELATFINRYGTDKSVYIESDFSSNDMTQVRDVHILEVKWLERFGAPKWLTGLMLHANSFAVSSMAHAVRARIRNQLPTGAQSTTFRNSLWNMTINYAFCKRSGAIGDVLILGDDMLMRNDNPRSTRAQQLRRDYEHVSRLACMKVTVKVRKHLSECEFLSKNFVMTSYGFVLVPKLGKAIARFNARASENEAISDSEYLAGKSLSYAYEFRHCPVIARMFVERYNQLHDQTKEVSLDALGWNAKGSFLALGTAGILQQINTVKHVMTRDDMTRFYHWKFDLTATDVIELLLATLFGEEDLDEAGCSRILEDFLD
jgi:hypothetical protein